MATAHGGWWLMEFFHSLGQLKSVIFCRSIGVVIIPVQHAIVQFTWLVKILGLVQFTRLQQSQELKYQLTRLTRPHRTLYNIRRREIVTSFVHNNDNRKQYTLNVDRIEKGTGSAVGHRKAEWFGHKFTEFTPNRYDVVRFFSKKKQECF